MAIRGMYCPTCQAKLEFELVFTRSDNGDRHPQMKWTCEHDRGCIQPAFMPSLEIDVSPAIGSITIGSGNVQEWFQTLPKRKRGKAAS